jgi:hypothetical protein
MNSIVTLQHTICSIAGGPHYLMLQQEERDRTLRTTSDTSKQVPKLDEDAPCGHHVCMEVGPVGEARVRVSEQQGKCLVATGAVFDLHADEAQTA